jgi:hypothetical protein
MASPKAGVIKIPKFIWTLVQENYISLFHKKSEFVIKNQFVKKRIKIKKGGLPLIQDYPPANYITKNQITSSTSFS